MSQFWILNFVEVILKRISNIYKKVKELKIHRDPRVLYCLIAVLIFLAGVLIGGNCFRKNNNNFQIDITPIQAEQLQPQDQTQAQSQTQTQPQPQPQDQSDNQSRLQEQAQPLPHSPVSADNVIAPPAPINNTKVLTVTVRHKDSLAKIFKRNGVDIKDAKAILALKQAKALVGLRAGKKISLTIEKIKTNAKISTKLKQLIYVIDELNTLTVVARGKGWHAHIKHIEPSVKLSYAAATIHGSIYTAASKKGIPRKMVAQLANIFSQKVDVNKLQKGDRLALFYKEYTVNGKKIKDGEIVAAEIFHKNRLHRMIGFTDSNGITDYYNSEGYNNKPPFMRIPVSYIRIGSRFSSNRWHPILKFSRPHLGVDFCAPFGTPVRATSNGRVEFVGTKGGHGRTIVLKRGIYSTLYAHLSGFSAGVFPGGYVKKGQIIGYVGATGLATGPHLHYEFHINGVHHDPLSVKLPEGEMIAPEHRKKFFALSNRMLAQLNTHRKEMDHRMLAINESAELNSTEYSV